jgi:hypothetical protein
VNNLTSKLEKRCEPTGEMADPNLAIEKAEVAVRLTPTDHPDLAGMLTNLGSKLERRYERTG